jgi:sulfane dehydrogenase subunit SoxC
MIECPGRDNSRPPPGASFGGGQVKPALMVRSVTFVAVMCATVAAGAYATVGGSTWPHLAAAWRAGAVRTPDATPISPPASRPEEWMFEMGKTQSDHEDCPCKEGMFPKKALSRRGLLYAAGSTAGAAAVALPGRALAANAAPPGAALYDVAADPTKELGRPLGVEGGYGTRSQFETAVRAPAPNPTPYTTWSDTPLASLIGNITPSGLHFERHHAGVPTIDPAKHSVAVHGLVSTAKRFAMEDIKRMPSVTRKHFIECSGNTNSEWSGAKGKTVQFTHGLLSTSEWTGVPFSTFARQVGLKPNGAWVLAEGADGAVMTRSIPIEKMLRDALIAYGQNGEAIRPEQGYPLRLVLPGYEGNTHIKWLQSLQVSDVPFMSREETSKYTDLMPDGRAWQFVFEMDAKSVITFPSGEMKLPGPGYYEISGLAWSGRGRISRVEVSTDGGRTWTQPELEGTPEPICTIRFKQAWLWDGKPALLLSRCQDETGYIQPTREKLVAERGLNAYYHYNGIQAWGVASDGSIANVAA